MRCKLFLVSPQVDIDLAFVRAGVIDLDQPFSIAIPDFGTAG